MTNSCKVVVILYDLFWTTLYSAVCENKNGYVHTMVMTLSRPPALKT